MSALRWLWPAVLLVPQLALAQPSALCAPSEGSESLQLEESFPARGTAGHLAVLVVKLRHGKGETLLAREVQIDGNHDGNKLLASSGFRVPDPASEQSDAGATAKVARLEQDDHVVSTLELPLLLLPAEAGTTEAILPPLPLSLVQASGRVITACTTPHAITIVDPTASVPTPKPRDNPPPLRQREHWQALENALWLSLAALVLAGIGALAYRSWSRRERPLPPPPPPRPPWELALEQLDALVQTKANAEPAALIDGASDILRSYLGQRYEFEGLESTTEEVLEHLRTKSTQVTVQTDVARVLRESDLVKFASAEAPREAADDTLDRVRQLIVLTIPEPIAAATPSEAR